MALNENAPYRGTVQYCMDYNAGTPQAFGLVRGGGYVINPHIELYTGIGGQAKAEGGVVESRVRAVCVEPLKSWISGALRATVTSVVPAKTLVFGNSDQEWTLTGCQPDLMEVSWAVGEPLTVEWEWLGLEPTQSEVGDTQAAVSGGLTDAWSAADVLFAAADYDCRRFACTLKNSARYHSSLDLRSEGSRRLPVAIRLGRPAFEIAFECRKQIPAATLGLVADSIVTNLGASVTATGVTFTFTNLHCAAEPSKFEDDDGFVSWRYRFGSHAWAPLAVS